MEVGLFTAFLGGLISFLSPCVLPLAPPYLAYLGGTTIDRIAGEGGEDDATLRGRVFLSAVFFVLGLGTVFVLLGMGASAIGQALLTHKAELGIVSGLIIYGLGLHFVGLRRALAVGAVVAALMVALAWAGEGGLDDVAWPVGGVLGVSALMQALGHYWQADHLPFLNREARFGGPAEAGSLGASYLIGVAFAFGWTPCIGPILAAILTLAAQQETLSAGTALLAVYALGLGMPFLVAALFVGPFLRWAHGFRRHMGKVETVMGVLLIVVGGMIMTGEFERLAWWLLETFPVLATFG